MDDYRGMAPDAKIAFVDLGDSSYDGVIMPRDLATTYFPLAFSVGARVHSDSWGSASTGYDLLASEVDLFSWQNQVMRHFKENLKIALLSLLAKF